MGQLKTYDYNQVAVIIGGSQVSGLAEGDDVVSVEQDADAWNLTVGADGESTRSKSNNNSGTVTLKLMQTSDMNDILSSYYQADKLSNAGKFPVMIKDNSGRTLHMAEQAWVQKLPTSSFGANAGEREWVIRTGELVSTIGGN
jgi:hypothetical protein